MNTRCRPRSCSRRFSFATASRCPRARAAIISSRLLHDLLSNGACNHLCSLYFVGVVVRIEFLFNDTTTDTYSIFSRATWKRRSSFALLSNASTWWNLRSYSRVKARLPRREVILFDKEKTSVEGVVAEIERDSSGGAPWPFIKEHMFKDNALPPLRNLPSLSRSMSAGSTSG
jgi:hypothetical protein